MKCSVDQAEMERGILARGVKWTKFVSNIFTKFMNPNTFAYKCPKCGKVELKVEQKGE